MWCDAMVTTEYLMKDLANAGLAQAGHAELKFDLSRPL